MDYEIYRIIGKITSVIQKEKTVDDAFKSSLKVLMDSLDIDYAIIWHYSDSDQKIHPFYWICPFDLTSYSYALGDSVIGKSYQNNDVIIKQECSKDDYFGPFNNISSQVIVPFGNEQIGNGCISFLSKNKMSSDTIDVCQILSLYIENTIKESISSYSWENRKVILSLKDIKKDFKNGEFITKVLKGVSFDIFEGEFLCLLGESGCGKSTLLNIVGGMEKPTSGSFYFKGKDYSTSSEKELTNYRKDNIGFIFQSYNLMPNLTAKQNLDLIGELVKNPLDSLETLKLVGLENKANDYPSELSGGQQQRVSIARALTKNPVIIMADEPTAALDYETSIEVLGALENVVSNGTTLVMVTHNEEIARMANRVIRFRDGKVYEITVNNKPASAKELIW